MLNILKQIHSEFPEMDIDTLLRIASIIEKENKYNHLNSDATISKNPYYDSYVTAYNNQTK